MNYRSSSSRQHSSTSTSSSSALPSSRKTHSEKHKLILKQLLKEQPNKMCVDCKTATHPRWASWNLGCFICIRCSGIHRSMGVHISKVKSVDLDAWTDEQVESMVKWGNNKCNQYWEAKLPDNYVPDASKIENFIRTKYDLKKWVSSPTVPDPLTLKAASTTSSNLATSSQPDINHTQSKHTKHSKQSYSQPSSSIDLLGEVVSSKPTTTTTSNEADEDDDDFGLFTSSVSPTPSSGVSASPAPHSRVHSSSKPTSAASQLNRLPTTRNQVYQNNTGIQSAQSTGGSTNSVGLTNGVSNGRNDLKKSILSLYSSPSSSSSSFVQPQQPQLFQPQSYQQQQQQLQQQTPQLQQQQRSGGNSINSLSSSLSGLNFGPGASSSSNSTINNKNSSKLASTTSQSRGGTSSSTGGSGYAGSPSITPPVWNNEWSDATNNSNSMANNSSSTSVGGRTAGSANQWSGSTGGTLSMDDDLFKNVWS